MAEHYFSAVFSLFCPHTEKGRNARERLNNGWDGLSCAVLIMKMGQKKGWHVCGATGSQFGVESFSYLVTGCHNNHNFRIIVSKWKVVTNFPEVVTESPEIVTESPKTVTESPKTVTESPNIVTIFLHPIRNCLPK